MMTIDSARIRLDRPQRCQHLCQWQTWATIGMVLAVYTTMYVGVRIKHQAPNHELQINTGSRITDRLFAPLIGSEKAWFERKIPDANQLVTLASGAANSSGRKVLLVFGTKNCCRVANWSDLWMSSNRSCRGISSF